MAAVFLAAVAPASAKAPRPSVQLKLVEANRVVQANASSTYTAQCPRSRPHPVGGEFDVLANGPTGNLALAASYPQGHRGWVVVVKNRSDQPQGYFAGIICLGANAKFAYPNTTYVVQPRGYDFSGVNCPAAAPHSINGYFNVQTASDLGKALLADNGGAHVKHEFGVAGVKSFSDTPIGIRGGAVCTSLHTASFGSDSTVAAGMNDALSVACPRKTPLAVGGYAFPKAAADNGAVIIGGTGNVGRRQGFAAVTNLTDHAVPYNAGGLCVG